MPPITPETVTRGAATCAIYRDAPAWGADRTAAIGRFKCASTHDGAALLGEVCRRLTEEGFAAVIGPMDGDTWHSYRVVAESDGSPPFPLEPVSGPSDHAAFAAAGFAPISHYVSARTEIATAIEEPPPAVPGLSIENWDGLNAEGLIGRIYDMSLAAFERNAFYKSISRESFLELYRPMIPAMDRRFILFARRADRSIAGFLFAYANVFETPRPTSLVIKTYASAERGAGRLMVDAAHRGAASLGFTHAIHALMHVDNQSLDRSSRHGGVVFRRYALLGRRLAA